MAGATFLDGVVGGRGFVEDVQIVLDGEGLEASGRDLRQQIAGQVEHAAAHAHAAHAAAHAAHAATHAAHAATHAAHAHAAHAATHAAHHSHAAHAAIMRLDRHHQVGHRIDLGGELVRWPRRAW